MYSIDLYYEAKDEVLTEIKGGYITIMANSDEVYFGLRELAGWFPIVIFYLKRTGLENIHLHPAVVGYLIEDDLGQIIPDNFWGDTF